MLNYEEAEQAGLCPICEGRKYERLWDGPCNSDIHYEDCWWCAATGVFSRFAEINAEAQELHRSGMETEAIIFNLKDKYIIQPRLQRMEERAKEERRAQYEELKKEFGEDGNG